MKTLQLFKDQLPEYAKDIKLNLGMVLSEEGAPELTLRQIYIVALACAHACTNKGLVEMLQIESKDYLNETEINAAFIASTIMGMNNIYYRFIHLSSDKTYETMPAKLRMTSIATAGIDKSTFELASLAVSAINGCGMCMDAHAQVLGSHHNVSKVSIHSAIRIAAVIHAAAKVEQVEQK